MLDGRCHRDGQKSREYWQGSSRASVEDVEGSCRQTASTTRTSLWSSNKPDTWPSVPPLSSLENGDDANCPLGQPWSSIPEDDIKSGEAASAAAMRRVTGARSDETRSEFGAEAEQQPIHWDEEGMPRRRDRNPAGGRQGGADTRQPRDHPSHPGETMDTCNCRLCFGRSKALECHLRSEGGCERSFAVSARHEK